MYREAQEQKLSRLCNSNGSHKQCDDVKIDSKKRLLENFAGYSDIQELKEDISRRKEKRWTAVFGLGMPIIIEE